MEMHQLAKTAQVVGKVNRQEAFNCIKTMAESIAPENEPLRKELAILYRHFMPGKTAKPKTPFKWVFNATAGSKDVRNYLQYCYVADNYLVGTDGHRMHLRYGTDLEPGFYNGDGCRVDGAQWSYPDFQRVRPTSEKSATTQVIHKSDLLKSEIGTCGTGRQLIEVRQVCGRWLQANYLDQALAIFESAAVECIGEPDSAVTAIELRQGDLAAVFMPIRPSTVSHAGSDQ